MAIGDEYAQKTADALERQRVKLLGADASLVLFDRAGAALVTLVKFFFVARKSNLAIGEEYHEAEISEAAGMTQSAADHVETAHLSTMTARLTVSVVEQPFTAARTWKLRMTPIKKQ